MVQLLNKNQSLEMQDFNFLKKSNETLYYLISLFSCHLNVRITFFIIIFKKQQVSKRNITNNILLKKRPFLHKCITFSHFTKLLFGEHFIDFNFESILNM
jgi:hypothetical protein